MRQEYEPTGPLGGGMRALEASAGTGKTFAITSTVLRLVVERDDFALDRLLLVTFTRAATAELEDRVRRRLVEGHRALARAAMDEAWTSDDEVLQAVVDRARAIGVDEAQRRVEEALRTVDQATVTTIHGFCHQVLRAAAVHTGSDPAVQIDTDDDRLVRAVVDDWMIRFTHGADERLVELLAELRLRRDGLHAIARVVAGEPDPHLAPALEVDQLDPVAELDGALAALRDAVADPAATLAAAEAAREAGEINGNDTWAPTERRLLGRLAKLRDELADGGRPDPKTLEGFDPAHVTKSGKRMPERMGATPLPAAVDGLGEARIRVETWIRRRLAADVRAELRARRDLAGTASFADLLRQLAAALDADADGAIAAEIGGQFDAVLVDEFQDTDPVQWSILRRLFADVDVLHVVGDPKQAIYGWRGADLETYLRALDDAGDQTATMRTNWRSDRRLVDGLNHLLRPSDSLGSPGRVEYVEVASAPGRDGRLLRADGTDAAGLELAWVPGLAGAGAAPLRESIANEVAQDIVDVLGSDLTLPDGAGRRRLRAADCAVLVRRHKEAAAVATALRQRNVPVVVGGGDDVLLSPEAGAMADLLRVLVAPGDDRALRRVLVGPFLGLDANEVDGLEDRAWQRHAVDVRRWGETWAGHGIAAAVQRAIREGEAERRHARTREGDRTMTNLRHLTELLHRAEQEQALGTHALAAWFDARRAEAEDEQTPPERELRLERDDAAVQVLTVHAAKGLEFPLVWVPFLWTREGRGSDGPAPFVVNDPANDNVRTVALHAASTPAVRAQVAERVRLRTAYEQAEWEGGLRLAYVALTRAEHRCTIHLCNYDWQGSLVASPAWQLFWRELGSGRPGTDDPPLEGVHEDEDALRRALTTLASHEAIDLRIAAEVRPPTLLGADAAELRPPLAARSWERDTTLDVSWGRASFTNLLRGRIAPSPGTADAADEADHDQTVAGHGLAPLPAAACTDQPEVPLAPLPRGPGWGTFLHDVLEHADFGMDLPDLRELVADRVRWAPVRPSEDDVEVASRGLHAALATPLGPALDDLQLRDVARRDRLDELDFTLTLGAEPAASFTVGSIARVFDEHAEASDASLAAAAEHLRRGGSGRPVHGLLIGSIDLVLRHDGRFWIADYKSNGLGQWVDGAEGEDGRWCETEAHTTPARVLDAMVAGDYLLQAHLYLVALHRYLRARLGERYDYDEHVGGWAYLFLRGMTGTDVRRTDGLPHGIATGRPTRALVEDLDALLRGVTTTA